MATGNLNTTLRILREFQKIDSEFPLQYAICLIHIALNEGTSITELSKSTSMALSTISRIVGALSQKRQKGHPFELIKVKVSKTERRKKELYLSAKGRAIMSSLCDIIEYK